MPYRKWDFPFPHGVSERPSSGLAPTHVNTPTISPLLFCFVCVYSLLRGVCPSCRSSLFAFSLCFTSAFFGFFVCFTYFLQARPQSRGWWEGLEPTRHLRLRKIFGLGSRRGEAEEHHKQGFVDRGRGWDVTHRLGFAGGRTSLCGSYLAGKLLVPK